MIQILRAEHKLSIKRACSIARLSRAAYYKPRINWLERDRPVVAAIQAIVAEERAWGFWKCHDRLRLLGGQWNHKRVYRVYCAMRMNLPRKAKRRLPTRLRQSMTVVPHMNAVWAIDFMHDALYSGRAIRTFNVLDEANREALGIDVATSIPSVRVTLFLEQMIEVHGQPDALRCDNGPEFIAQHFVDWCKARGIRVHYIQPGKPDQNAFIERFNRTYRAGVLNAFLFDSLEQVQEETDAWLKRYNEDRPHDALGKLPPVLYRQQNLTVENSTLEVST